MPIKITLLALLICSFHRTSYNHTFPGEFITYAPVKLTAPEKQILKASLEKLHDRYDKKEKMLTRTITDWNYHTDAKSGTFHEVRSSFSYAVGLLDLDDAQYRQRAFDIIKKTISLQDTVTASRTCGVWPYYMEEPLATKKSPADFNWADFNAVSLLDVYMGHEGKLTADLKMMIKTSLIYAARSIMKRDVQPGYTNIAIMGTYVTFITSHLFELPDMQAYAANRLQKFYDYTLKRGFTEYNSPTYTIVALDELDRMQRHIIDKDARTKIDSLYNIGWAVIAKHFHKPSGQWAGPHSRAYSSLLQPSAKGIFKEASGGKIDLPGAMARSDVKIKHKIPAYLLPYFISPQYPRIEQDILSIDSPRIIGTTYMTDQYALSSANRSSLWNQRRPFLVYWGTPQKPYYLQVRFLHDLYDFSAACFYSEQKDNDVLAAINFITNGGDRHISIDRMKDGKFKAKDLRLRFEFGNVPANKLTLPAKNNDAFNVHLDSLKFNLQLYHAVFDQMNGRWEKGGDEKTAWVDYVVYSGDEKDFDLTAVDRAVLGFCFSISEGAKHPNPVTILEGGNLATQWKGLRVSVPAKPASQPRNL